MASTNIFAPQVRIIQPAFVYKDGEDNIYIWENVNNNEQKENKQYE